MDGALYGAQEVHRRSRDAHASGEHGALSTLRGTRRLRLAIRRRGWEHVASADIPGPRAGQGFGA
nr:hypothetical protein SHINE37_110336 [Rhizobiaceae bacterium]